MSSGASLSLPDGLFAPYELVRELGARPNPVYVVRQTGAATGGKPVLLVAERHEGGGAGAGAEELQRDARRIATLASPNLARVREVVVRGEDLVVFGEFVEGEKLQELWRPEKLPLEIALRALIDALSGLGALHNLRDAKQQPMKLAHGEVSPATLVFGLDGIARVLCSVSRRAPGVRPEPASSGYLAPEVASDDPYDARADVFSLGVMLWEALSGKRLLPEADPRAAAKRIRSSPLPAATVPDKAAWAKGLVDVAAKALAAHPDDRWPTVAVLSAEVRKAAGLKLAPASTAAAFARSAFGERVKARREALEAVSQAAPRPAAARPASPAAPPAPAPAAPAPEPSFVDVELESAIDTVLVAPGIRAPVEEVVELGSESLLEAASDSIAPPAASSAVGGFVLDPFMAAPPDAFRAAPPPASPAVAIAPVVMLHSPSPPVEPEPPSITGAPHFAAAIDPPVAQPAPQAFPAPSPIATYPVSLPVEIPAEDELPGLGAARRRKAIVLGGVATLGLVVFLLAAVRIARREPDAAPAPPRSVVATAPAASPPVGPRPVAAAAATAPATTSAAPPSPPGKPAPALVTATVPPPVPVAATPTPKPTPVVAAAAPRPASAAQAPAATKPRPKPTFDPNSL